MSQERFAERVGVSSMTVSKFETGRRKPSLKTLKRVSEFSGYPLCWICDPELRASTLPFLRWSTDSDLRITSLFGPLTMKVVRERARLVGSPVAFWLEADSPLLKAHGTAGAEHPITAQIFALGPHWLQVSMAARFKGEDFAGLDALALLAASSSECSFMLPQCEDRFRHLEKQVQALK